MNALCDALMVELAHALEHLDSDDAIGAIVLTGNGERAFAGKVGLNLMASVFTNIV